MSQEQSSSPDLSLRLPWAGRFHVVRLALVSMVLGVLAVQVAACGEFTTYHVLLVVFGIAYPFLVRLLLGRFEARRRHGRISLLLDGFLAGALIPAIAFDPAASAVILLISLFNWIAVGGPAFAGNGLAAMSAGFGVSLAVVGLQPIRSCVPASGLAYGVLAVYLPFVAWVVYRYSLVLRQRCEELQMERDRAETARRQADRGLLAVLPDSVAREVAETGTVARRTLPMATLLLAVVRWSSGAPRRVDWFAGLVGPCADILRRHDLDLVKTFGGRFLAMAADDAAVDRAVAAAKEMAAYFRNHGGGGPDGGSEWPLCLVIHCGPVEAGLVQADTCNYDILGEPLDEATALANTWDAPGVLLSAVARARLRGDWRLQALGEAGAPVFLLVERDGQNADLATNS